MAGIVIFAAMVTALFGLVFKFRTRAYRYDVMVLEKENCIINDKLEKEQIFTSKILRDCESTSFKHFSRLNGLLDLCYESCENKHVFSKRIKTWVSAYNDDEFISDIKLNLNRYRNNICYEFQNSFPNCTKDAERLFLLKCIGLSDRAISLIGDENIANVYSRKYRLRRMIIESKISNKHKGRFMNELI